MVRSEIVYEGGLRTRCTHEPSGNEIQTDAPVDNHGRGESFSPTDLLATSLGTCMLTVMGIVAERHDWSLVGARVTVEKHMATRPVRRVGRLVVNLALPSGFDAEARKLLENAAQTCPVKRSLHPDVEAEIHFDWAD